MKFLPARRELYKNQVKHLMMVRPRLNNIEIAQRLGLHRNTVGRLLEEISIEINDRLNQRLTSLMVKVEDDAQFRQNELNCLWIDSYHSLYDKKPAQLVKIVKMNWQITKDVYQFNLEFLGLGRRKEKPFMQSNVQVNIGTNNQQQERIKEI